MSLRRVLLSCIVAACSAATVYNTPEKAGNALDVIEAALTKIVSNPHLTAAQLKSAKAVSSSVEKTVTELESKEGKLLSKEAKAAKVTAAIQQLQGLQDEWQKLSTQGVSQKKADLSKQLAEKEAELAKEEKMLKVINLEKKLAEKKLALEKLVEMKNAQKQGAAQKRLQEEAQKEAAVQQELVTNVLKMSKEVQAAQSKGSSMSEAATKELERKKADMLKGVMTHLEARMKNVTTSLNKIDYAEHGAERSLAKTMKAPVNGSSDIIAQGKSMMKMLMKQEHRQFEKARAPLKTEYKELSDALTSIKKGDVASLSKVMGKMQGEMKSLQAKSHKFLY